MRSPSAYAALIAAGFAICNGSAAGAQNAFWASATDQQHPCDAGKVQSYVGRVAEARTVAEITSRSGSATVRVVMPGQPISMDYNTARLTIEVDEKNRIVRLYCG
jgi:hypothetical protein